MIVSGTTMGAMAANEKVVGAWKLVSAASTTKNGEPGDPPYGPEPAGVLTYTEDGRMSSLISYGGRKPLSIGGSSSDMQQEQAEAFKTFFAYAGRFHFTGDKMTHHVEISSIQNYVGKDLLRHARLQGDRLILTAPPTLVNGKIQSVELVWERLPRATETNS